MLTKAPAHSDDDGLRRFAIPGDVYNATPPRIIFGPGSVAGIVDELAQLGVRRALVISTPGRHEMAASLAERLGSIAIGSYAKAISQVPIELVEAGHKDAAALGADCLVAIGGGAAIGLGKGIALHSGLPLVAIPSTYSGSEMTGFCGITIAGVKRMHTSLLMLPRIIIYDSDLTMSLPTQVSADSAMNAMAHCIEALYVGTASPIIALAALEGVRVIGESLPRLMKSPNDPAARANALYGAYLGGAALTGGFALHHGVAHVLGGTYGLPHAISHSVALPYVTEYNTDAVPDVMRKVADVLGAKSAASGIYDFAKSIGSPVCLADYNFTRADLPRCADIVLETDNGLNPKEVTREGVLGILEAAFAGRRPAE